jgi:hypothetical protein
MLIAGEQLRRTGRLEEMATIDLGEDLSEPLPAMALSDTGLLSEALEKRPELRRIAGDHGHAQIIAAGTVEIGLRQRRARGNGRRQEGERHHTRPEPATDLHLEMLSNARLSRTAI